MHRILLVLCAILLTWPSIAAQRRPLVYKGGGHIDFSMTEPYIPRLAGVKSNFYLFEAAGAYGASGWTVDNIIASAASTSPPGSCGPPLLTITLHNCAADVTCAAPIPVGTVDIDAAGVASLGTISNPMILSGDYLAWEVAEGPGCGGTANFSATAQIHAN